MTEQNKRILGNYLLLHVLGRGGFADVYLGRHIHLDTQAAIKLLHTQLVKDSIERFRQEARTIARLEHPHIVRILDFGVQESTPFLVMSYASNGTLRQLHPRNQQVPLSQVVSYVQQIAIALQYAHQQHIIHRDIKPENLLIGTNHEIMLSDFGIALVTSDSQLLPTQETAGTIAYMAPEQLHGHPQPASDQYSLAIVTYEWLSGQRPFEGGFSELAFKHSMAPVPSLHAKVPNLPIAVEEVILKALRKDPEQRFSSIQAFSQALEQATYQATTPLKELSPTPSSPFFPQTQIVAPPREPLPQPLLTPRLSYLSQYSSRHQAEMKETIDDHLLSLRPLPPPAIPKKKVRFSRRSLLLSLATFTMAAGIGTAGSLFFLRSRGTYPPSQQTPSTFTPATNRPVIVPTIKDRTLSSTGATFGFDLQHSRFQPEEHLLSTNSVSRLTPRWSHSCGGPVSVSSPAVANGKVYIGSDNGSLLAFDANTGQPVWSYSTTGPIYSSPAVSKNMVYIGSRDSKIYALDAQNGLLHWSFLTGDIVDSSPAIAQGVVYIGSNDYKLYAIDAVTAQPLWTYDTRYLINTSPAIANNLVYFGSPNAQLYAFNTDQRNLLWSASTMTPLNTSPTIANGLIYIGANDGKLSAFEIGQGRLQWVAATGDAIYSSPAVAYQRVYVGSDDGNLYAFSTGGKKLWQMSLGQPIRSSPTIANNVVYVGCDDGNLYALHATTGEVLWSYSVGKIVRSSPTVANGIVYVGSDDGKLYAFHVPGH